MTTAADRFTDAIATSWDSSDPYELTAELGLSEVDADALRTFCEEAGDDYHTAEAEVLAYVRAKVIR